MSIHRRVARPDLIKVEKTLYMTTSVAIEVRDSEGRIKSTYSSPETPRPDATPEKKEAKVTFSFKEYPQDDIVDICRKICSIMEKLVEDASSKFP